MLSLVTTGIGDRLWAGTPPQYVTKPTRLTQSRIPPESVNRVPALIGWHGGGNVSSPRWQVTLRGIWQVSSCIIEASCITAIYVYLTLPLPLC